MFYTVYMLNAKDACLGFGACDLE